MKTMDRSKHKPTVDGKQKQADKGKAATGRVKVPYVAVAAHELRSPLAAIYGYLSAYLSGAAGTDPKTNRNMLERAKVRTRTLLDLVDDLLRIETLNSKKTAGKEAVELGGAIRNAVELILPQCDAGNIRVEIDIAGPLPPVKADRVQMEELFTNLVSNAVKYNVSNGRVIIRAKPVRGFVEVQVTDTGVGMDRESLRHVFEPFYRVSDPQTRRVPGTGLGLSIVKKIVESHSGRITIKSEPGKGTTVIVKLPMKDHDRHDPESGRKSKKEKIWPKER